MKRVKVALTAVAVFAVVGGALAFKANRLQDSLFVHAATDTKADRCTLQSFGISTIVNGQPSATVASTTALTANCKVINVYEGD